MSWSIGYDDRWNRDIGYGVPAFCDCGCGKEIDRGLAYVCGGEPYGGDFGCGLHFAYEHLLMAGDRRNNVQLCKRCYYGKKPYTPTPDRPEWIKHKLTDPSWKEWRKKNPEEVKKLKAALKG